MGVYRGAYFDYMYYLGNVFIVEQGAAICALTLTASVSRLMGLERYTGILLHVLNGLCAKPHDENIPNAF